MAGLREGIPGPDQPENTDDEEKAGRDHRLILARADVLAVPLLALDPGFEIVDRRA